MMADKPTNQTVLRVAELSSHKPFVFNIVPGSAENARIADELGLSALRKLNFRGKLMADGKSDWRLEATLGATVVQPCVVTLAPVTTRIDQDVARNFLATMPELDSIEEIEMPEDETSEPLGDTIDLILVMTEALALALPDYPRSDDAHLENAEFSAPGITPLTDKETKPFAGLAGLRDKLEKGD